ATALYSAVLLSTLSMGCSGWLTRTEREQVVRKVQPRASEAEITPASASDIVPANALTPLAAVHDANHGADDEHTMSDGKKETRSSGNSEGDEREVPQSKQKITLPMAIEMCVNNNFRVLAGAERMRSSEADLVTSSLIPNPSLFADCQLIPSQHTDITDQ